MRSTLVRFLIRALYLPSVALNRILCALGIWNRWDWVDEYLLLGAVPARRHIHELAELGISAIVNLCDEFPGHQEEMRRCGLSQLHLPTVDYHCPSIQSLESGVQFIRDRAAAGQKTYVHCKAGQGRSAALAICYLMAAYGLTPGDAYMRLKSVRPHINRRLDRKEPIREFSRRIDPLERNRGRAAADAL